MSESAPNPARPGAVFLSYAREDSAAASRIAAALRAFGVEVWFDQAELRGGDAWDARIRKQIKQCSLFVPIISAQTQARSEAYFRLEWNLAEERTHLMVRGAPFILPVAIDDVAEADALVPERFRDIHWLRLPGGEPTSQFVDRIKRLVDSARVTGHGAISASHPARETAGKNGPQRKSAVLVVTATVALLALASFALWQTVRRKQTTATVSANAPVRSNAEAAKSIAVLPLSNMSDDKDNTAFFADGVHEDILTYLGIIRELRVISRTSVVGYRDTTKKIAEIARELGVNYILEGTVRRAGSKVVVTSQLIEARTDEHIWAKRYEKDLTDIFAIQSELAQEIARSLHTAISPQEKKFLDRKPTDNPMAYDLYLKARMYNDGLGNAASRKSRETFLAAAVDTDPNFAIAWAELGSHQVNDGNVTAGKLAIDTALRLAPDSPEVIAALGRYFQRAQRDDVKARAQFDRAERLQPNNPRVLASLARLSEVQGQWMEALSYRRTLAQIDPGHILFARQFVTLLEQVRRYDEAKIEQRRVTKLAPDDLVEAFWLAWIPFLATGSTTDAAALISRLTPQQANSTVGVQIKKRFAYLTGDLAEYGRLALLKPNDSAPLRGPNTNLAHRLMGRDESVIILAATGDLNAIQAGAEEFAAIRERAGRTPESVAAWILLAERQVLVQEHEEALRSAKKAVELSKSPRGLSTARAAEANLAFVYAWSGDKERALAEYQRLLQTCPIILNVHEMKRDPRYKPLQGDPRFDALLNDPKNNAPLF